MAFLGTEVSLRKLMSERLDPESMCTEEAIKVPDAGFSNSDMSEPKVRGLTRCSLRKSLLARLQAARLVMRPPVLPKPLTRKRKVNQNATIRGRTKRAKNTVPGEQKDVAKKRGLEATKVTLKLPLDMGLCAAVTAPGWMGKGLRDAPRTSHTIEVLRERYNMALFDWDGRCVFDMSTAHSYLQGCIT